MLDRVQDLFILEEGIKECMHFAKSYITNNDRKYLLSLVMGVQTTMENISYCRKAYELSEHEINKYKMMMLVPVMVSQKLSKGVVLA